NIWYVSHVAPADHAAFFSSSRVTLNVTRRDMAALGFCPSGRMFEAAACGPPLMSDAWPGIEGFFTPGTEILVVSNSEEATAELELSDADLGRIARAARKRMREEHTSSRRQDELILRLEETRSARPTRTCRTCEANRNRHTRTREMWGVIPAAGNGSRIQPLAFSKELLPVGAREDERGERPRAVSEYLLERLIAGGADKVCFVIAPGKFDILQYFGGRVGSADIAYVVQPRAAGLCDAVFRAAPLVHPGEPVAIGLPDTIWFPEDA